MVVSKRFMLNRRVQIQKWTSQKAITTVYWQVCFFISGHCKKLTPEFISAAATLAAKDPPRYLAKVDATEEKKTGERFGIQGFPTLKWFV